MNDTLDRSSKAINIERAAYNEAGHAIVGRFQGEMDMLQAEALARRRYPDDPQKQEEMLHNSTSLARKILSEPSCWRAVKNLAQAAAEVLVKEPVLNSDQVHRNLRFWIPRTSVLGRKKSFLVRLVGWGHCRFCASVRE